MSSNSELIQLLFSYGTLQNDHIQLEIFGRKLIGLSDKLRGFRIERLEIASENELQGENEMQARYPKSYPVAVTTNNSADYIKGTVYQLTKAELERADFYETNAYKRELVELASGKSAWVYVSA